MLVWALVVAKAVWHISTIRILVLEVIVIEFLTTCRAENLPFLNDSTAFAAVVFTFLFIIVRHIVNY